MTLRLRPHHLLCMLTYVGRGYSPAFTANYDAVVNRIRRREDIILVGGPDDICAPLLGEENPHCLRKSVCERDRQAAGALSRLLAHPVEPGACIVPDTRLIERMRHAFASGRTRKACLGCQWAKLCSSVADSGYRGAYLSPESTPTGSKK